MRELRLRLRRKSRVLYGVMSYMCKDIPNVMLLAETPTAAREVWAKYNGDNNHALVDENNAYDIFKFRIKIGGM